MADDPQGRGEAQLIEHLVGSVLSSVVKAQGLAASQLIDMVDKIGFEAPAPGAVGRQVRTFSFDFFRSELDPATNQIVRKQITASVPLLTLINLPAISIQEATIDMELQLVAHEQSDTGADTGALNLYVVPAKKQVVRTSQQALVVDSAGTIKIHVVMRQESALGLDKIQSLLDGGSEEKTPPAQPPPEILPPK